MDDFYGAQVIGGAIFKADIDRSHPINFGYGRKTINLLGTLRSLLRKIQPALKIP